MKIGFIGLGQMGAAAAANIRRGGYELWVYDLEPSRANALLNAGAIWAPSPAELTDAVDVVITMLPGPMQIASVMRDSTGVLSRLRPRHIWVDMTTNSPALVRELALEVKACGGASADAPVTGAVDGAIQGRLTFFGGGDEHDRISFVRCWRRWDE